MTTIDLASAKRLAISLPLPSSCDQTLLSRWLGGGTSWRELSQAAWDVLAATGDYSPADPNTPAAATIALLDSGALDAHMTQGRRQRLRPVLQAIIAERVLDASIVSAHEGGVIVACPYCWPENDGRPRQHSHRLPEGASLPMFRVPACPPGSIPHAYRIIADGGVACASGGPR